MFVNHFLHRVENALFDAMNTGVISLFILGFLLHVAAVLCMFDIYFRSPLVHGMPNFHPTTPAPSRRLVFIVDKLFELNDRAPFLRSIIEKHGVVGVSHTRVPTESRPGHVALISGFYEDVSAVTTGWKENPIEFDSVFNESRWTWAWGSPDILPMFSKRHEDHIFSHSYNSDIEDFGQDPSIQDEWVFSQFELFLEQSKKDPVLEKRLHEDKIVFFFHLLATDTIGHSKKPYSDAYINNIEKVDKGVKRMVQLIEAYYGDNSTSFVFTADHGMSDKGNHGDGERANTETPIIAWSKGLRQAQPHDRDAPRIVSPASWNLNQVKRTDIAQADVAALMSYLIGIPFPLNSVGVVPLDFLVEDNHIRANVLLNNAKQIYAQVDVVYNLKMKNTLLFKPWRGRTLADGYSRLNEIANLIQTNRYESAISATTEFIQDTLKSLTYYQTYDRTLLLLVTSLNYLGWIINILLLILQNFSAYAIEIQNLRRRNDKMTMMFFSGLLTSFTSLLFIQNSPIQYYIYIWLGVLMWWNIANKKHIIFQCISRQQFFEMIKDSAVSIGFLAFQIAGFFRRELFGIATVLVGAWIYMTDLPAQLKATWLGLTLLISAFTLFPVGFESYYLVILGGALLSVLCFVALRLLSQPPQISASSNSISLRQYFQAFTVIIASLVVWNTELNLQSGLGLPYFNSVTSYILLFISVGSFLSIPKSRNYDLFVLLSLSMGTPFLLLSVGYEMLFYSLFSVMLLCWIHFEEKYSDLETQRKNANVLTRADLRISLFYVLFCWVAFFGTGNIASISSFQISSVFRFMTVFDPFAMGALLIFKLLLPFALVSCAFAIIVRLRNTPIVGSFYFVFIAIDFMAINFFFLVKDEGSWLEIGSSISHFVGVNAFILFHMVLFVMSNFILRNGFILRSRHQL